VSVESHSYAGPADLAGLVEFARTATRARWPRTSGWHPGDVVWGLCTATSSQDCLSPLEDLRVFTRHGAVVGFVWFESADHFLMDVHAEAGSELELREELLSYAERARRCAPSSGQQPLSTIARASDAAFVSQLERRGYVACERADPRMRRSLEAPIPSVVLPRGFHVRDCSAADFAERAAAHRDAWSHLDHLGIQNARSRFTVEVYERLRAAPVYDPELDLVVVAPDGTYASCCICWADCENRIGLFEPVGTRIAYRRQGLGRALNLEGLRRLRSKGMQWAAVGTASFNEPARATYLSCGFEIIDEDRWFEKSLD
jgi:predicted N-acetyltransferase YhbS